MTYGNRIETALDAVEVALKFHITRPDFVRLALACLDQASVSTRALFDADSRSGPDTRDLLAELGIEEDA